MTFFERNRRVPHFDHHPFGFVRFHHFDVLRASAEPVSCSQGRIEDEGFVPVWVNVDQLDHEIGVETVRRCP